MISERHGLLPLEPPAFSNDDDGRWQLVQRIVGSRRFQRAPLLSRFLVHICAETLRGRQQEITEYQIGIQVFDRPRSYRTVEDNIVRNYARQLRKRLAEYAADEGKDEPYRIEIPLGGYIPVFTAHGGHCRTDEMLPKVQESREPTLADRIVVPPNNSTFTTPETDTAKHSVMPRLVVRLSLLAVYTILLVGITATILGHFQPARGAVQPTSMLWTSLFRSPLNTFVVPADSGFNLIEDLSKRQVPLGGYLKGDYLALPLPAMDEHSRVDLSSQEFTSFVDLQVVSAIARLPEVDPHRLFIRFPRDLRMDDLKTGNTILIGSIGSNPWAELAQQNLNFRITYSNEMQHAWVEDINPMAGEAKHYESVWSEPAHPTYAVIAYEPNLAGTGHILLIEGLDVAGTQAAADALLHGDTLLPVLRAARQSNGDLRPFEVLLESTSIQSNAVTTHVVASRIE